MLIGKLLAMGVLAVLCFVGINYLADSVVIGTAVVVDGDSLKIGDKQVTLAGLAAMQQDQVCEFAGKKWPCGLHAAAALKRAIANRTVTCRPVADKQNDERPCRCYVGTQEDLGKRMVAEGWAIVQPTPDVDYTPDQALAQQKLAGVWSSLFANPTKGPGPEHKS